MSRAITRQLCLAIATTAAIVAATPALGKSFRTPRPVRAVVVGGSISMYYKGNYGEYLQHGCKNLEVVNRAKVGAGGRALVKRLKTAVLQDKQLMKEVRRGEAWLIFQGGLNSVFSPEMTNWYLARMFKLAADSGMRTFALTLTPWGDDGDKRFKGWEGLRYVRATKMINRFLLAKLTPDQALGRRAAKHPHEWLKGELPEVAVDVYHSELRAKSAPLRAEAPLRKSFRRSRYRKRGAQKDKLIEQARAVPRGYLAKGYRDFDHIHPNTKGHRLLAVMACKKAPASWGCDCAKIGRAVWKKGKVRGK